MERRVENEVLVYVMEILVIVSFWEREKEGRGRKSDRQTEIKKERHRGRKRES